jgi:hypothetical protein
MWLSIIHFLHNKLCKRLPPLSVVSPSVVPLSISVPLIRVVPPNDVGSEEANWDSSS